VITRQLESPGVAPPSRRRRHLRPKPRDHIANAGGVRRSRRAPSALLIARGFTGKRRSEGDFECFAKSQQTCIMVKTDPTVSRVQVQEGAVARLPRHSESYLVRLTPQQLSDLSEIAIAEGNGIAAVIRRFISLGIARDRREAGHGR
jgi:hypothetical protein